MAGRAGEGGSGEGGERGAEDGDGAHRVAEEPVSAVLYAGGEGTDVRLRVLHHPRGRRLRRAAAGLGLLWLLAAVSVFIPIAHLILVPGFFLGGIGLAVVRWKRRDRFAEFRARCPVCGEDHAFDLQEAAELPQRLRCPDLDAPMILKAG
ncbi:MAG TPA: hypothetical protein VKA44_05385 [Gemmatimonadota bacterium]|nr:hypothetical protein [Gemmatimonadota bacterium]